MFIVKITILKVGVYMESNVKKKRIRKKPQVVKKNCVACGTCLSVCPVGAISIVGGVFAEIDQTKCIGCLKCLNTCPASTIEAIIKEEGI